MAIKIKQVQQLLVNLGKKIAIDGIWGVKSQAAMDEALEETKKSSFDELVETTMPSYSEIPNSLDEWTTIKHFKRKEFCCKCGGKYCNGYPAEMDMDLIRIADGIREHFGVEARVSSGLRCERWNAIQGGVANSRHRLGKAMDFCVLGVPGGILDAYIGSLHGIRYHYHISNGYCHMDVL